METEGHLKQRVARQIPLGLQLRHQLLERQILVSVRPERRLLHPPQQLPEAQPPLYLRAQHQGVDEEPDETLDLSMHAPGNRRADHHIALAAPARQHDLQSREQHHVQRGPRLPPQLRQRRGQRLRKCQRPPRPLEARQRWTRPVGRQLQHRRRPGQLAAPVIQLPLQRFSLQPAPLPQRIVRILHGQVRKRRVLPVPIRCVERAELPHQHAYRPPVRDDVVHRKQQNVLLLTKPQQ